MTTHGVTGHRFVEQQPGELDQFARLSVARMLTDGATEIISGMAMGWDLAVAEACIDLGVPFIAALPFPGQESLWPASEQERYRAALGRAAVVQYIGRMPLNALYHRRDRWIVDQSVKLWALCDGRPGGTFSTVLYAIQAGSKIEDLWDDWMSFRNGGGV